MKINLKTISGDALSTLEVQGHATLADLKETVRESETYDLSTFSLLLDGVHLTDFPDVTALSACGIEEGTILILVKGVVPKVLTASHDKTVKIWDSSTGECEQTFPEHSGAVCSAVFSGDRSSVLTASGKTAIVWDRYTGECKQTFSGHSCAVWSAVFSGDGSSVLSLW